MYINHVVSHLTPNSILNNRQMILNTVKWLLAFADESTYDNVPVIDDPSPFMTCVYLSSILTSHYQVPLHMNVLELESVQNGNFNRTVNYLHIVQRSVECFIRIAAQEERFSPREYVNLSQAFRNATDVDIHSYVFFLTAIMSSSFPSGSIESILWTNRMVYNIDDYVRHLEIPLIEVQLLFQMLTISMDEFRETSLSSLSSRWDFNYFRYRPLIRLGNLFYPLDSQFILENLWDVLYWRIHDGLDTEAAAKFRVFFGRVFELYCNDLLEQASPNLVRAKYIREFEYTYERNRLMSPDAFIDYGSDLLAIDYKTKRLKMQATLVEGNLDSLEQDLLQMIIEPARKIHAHLKKFISRPIAGVPIDFTCVKRVHGIIVTQGSFSGVKSLYEKIEEKLRIEGLYDLTIRIDWHILDVNEFEAMVSLIEQNINLANTFVQKASSRYRHISFHDYLAYARRPHRHSEIAKQRFSEWLDYVVSVMSRNQVEE